MKQDTKARNNSLLAAMTNEELIFFALYRNAKIVQQYQNNVDMQVRLVILFLIEHLHWFLKQERDYSYPLKDVLDLYFHFTATVPQQVQQLVQAEMNEHYESFGMYSYFVQRATRAIEGTMQEKNNLQVSRSATSYIQLKQHSGLLQSEAPNSIVSLLSNFDIQKQLFHFQDSHCNMAICQIIQLPSDDASMYMLQNPCEEAFAMSQLQHASFFATNVIPSTEHEQLYEHWQPILNILSLNSGMLRFFLFLDRYVICHWQDEAVCTSKDSFQIQYTYNHWCCIAKFNI